MPFTPVSCQGEAPPLPWPHADSRVVSPLLQVIQQALQSKGLQCMPVGSSEAKEAQLNPVKEVRIPVSADPDSSSSPPRQKRAIGQQGSTTPSSSDAA